ncbi:MAG: GntR family transcriptional regulator [Clostridia bacterium]|nr:GntR family transcriptional regulator [Clostridia bacterium]
MAVIKSLPQQIYEHIVDKIKFGEFAPGEKLDEAALIQELEISRTPIREALIQLAADGIIDNIPRKGFYIKAWNLESMLEAYGILACLDTYAVNLALEKLDKNDYKSMQRAIEEMDLSIKQQDYTAFCTWQEHFHLTYLKRCENNTLYEMIQTIKKQYLRQTYYNKDYAKLFGLLQTANAEHKEILAAIIEKNSAKLNLIIKEHWTKNDPEMW